jgi:predicted aminopeptidase
VKDKRVTSMLARLAGGLLMAGALAEFLQGCTTAGYYWQSISGHVRMMNAARPVDDWLQDAQTTDVVKGRLALSQRIRDFASTQLALPDNSSYRRYADLNRSSAVWNVVAAPPLSLTLKTWCFPVAGCVGYRGYFSEHDARAEADRVQQVEALETSVYGVPAYSTLGWLNWAGGDPLLNTFIRYPDGELARLIFHELAHQVAYAAGDTTFNESFATAVERIGGAMWLDSETARGNADPRKQYDLFNARRRSFRTLVQDTRRALQQVYESNDATAQDIRAQAATKLIAKEKIMQTFRSDYEKLRSSWDGYAGYDAWVARANNASFGALAAYDDLVPGFEALFEREGRSWPRYYDEVRRLAALPKSQRTTALQEAAHRP